MSDITRRALLGTAAAGLAGGAEQAPAADAAKPRPTHKFRLAAMKATEYPGGTVREATVNNFPASQQMSGAILTIRPGGLRELHWHPNAVEWDYILAGKARFTIFSPKGRTGEAETIELEPGDVAYIPQGYGHYIENVGPDECRILLVFNAGAFDEISSTGWLASTPREVLAKNFGVPEKTFADFPKKEAFLPGGRKP